MKFLLLVAFLPGGTGSVVAQQDSVTITEVMFDPFGADSPNEFVEIYNYSSSTIYNLSSWRISDSSGVDTILAFGEGLLLAPGQFGIILEGDYSFGSGLYDAIIPDAALVLRTHTSDIGSGGLRNSPPETLYLISSAADTASAYRYSGGSPNGLSDEKIMLSGDNSPLNWVRGILTNGTPGAPPTLDLSLTGLSFNPTSPPSGTSVTVNARVKNTGIRTVESGVVVFYYDVNRNGVPEDSEAFDSLTVPSLARLDSTLLSVVSPVLGIGKHDFIASLHGSSTLPTGDTITSNNAWRDSIATVAQFDIALSSTALMFNPAIPTAGDSVQIRAVALNAGLALITGFLVRFFDDRNLNGLPDPDEIIDSIDVTSSLAAGDSVQVFGMIRNLEFRTYSILAAVTGSSLLPSADEDPLNDQRSGILRVGTKLRSLVINEIDYNVSAGQSEWIEIFNRSADTLDLRKWQIADGNSDQTAFTTKKTITTLSHKLPPSEFLVVGKDSAAFLNHFPNLPGHRIFFSTFPALNNSGDMIGLFDSLGTLVDSVQYLDDWGGTTDRSLERRYADSTSTDPLNWATSIHSDGATPGFVNSVSPVPYDLSIQSGDVYTMPAFSEKGLVAIVTVIVRNLGLNPSSPAQVIVSIDLDQNGLPSENERLDSTALPPLQPGQSASSALSWAIPSSIGDSVRLFAFVSYAQDERLENNQSSILVVFRTPIASVVVNEILPDPNSSQTEFVEIVNRSNMPINLKNWKIRDLSSTKTIITKDLWIPPAAYRVMSSDTSVYGKFQLPDSLVILVSSMPSLNNDSDDVVLTDAVGAIVDSLRYYPNWGGRKGTSIERFSINQSTTDPSNWNACLSAGGQTAGFPNSLLNARAGQPGSIVINEIMYAPLSGEPEFVEIFNTGDSTVNLLNWSLDIGGARSILSSSDFAINSGEFVVFSNTPNLPLRYQTPSGVLLVPATNLSTLNNNGSAVVLRDVIGTTIDSVTYQPQWGGSEGFSLEKIRPGGEATDGANWGSCVYSEGGTPGRLNSIYADAPVAKLRISVSPNPFLRDREPSTTIMIDLPVTQSRLTIRLYDNQGRLIQTLLNNSPSGSHREVTWDGRTKDGTLARMGIYVVYVDAISEAPGFHKSAKKTLVLGKKL